MVTPIVSILIPAYNAEAWIADTIRSAVAQTWPRTEIIVVDDGSTDQTLAVARQFASKGVLVVTGENRGAAATRNKAFSLCQGDYVQWLDADDLLSPDKVAKQLEVAERESARRTLLSAAWGYFMYRPRRADFTPTALWCDLAPAEWLIRKMGENLFMQTATWLVSRELTEAAGPWDTRLLSDDDGEYFCRVLLASDGVRFVPEGKVFYRISGFGRVSYIGRSDKKIEAVWLSMHLHISYLRSLEDSERVRAACVRYLQNSLLTFYPERIEIVEEAQRLAAQLGGRLEAPRLPRKYEWSRRLFGWRVAKNAQVILPRVKWSVQRLWDQALGGLEGHAVGAIGETAPRRG